MTNISLAAVKAAIEGIESGDADAEERLLQALHGAIETRLTAYAWVAQGRHGLTLQRPSITDGEVHPLYALAIRRDAGEPDAYLMTATGRKPIALVATEVPLIEALEAQGYERVALKRVE